jgi:GntR family transcriptional regulator/MocR family aminotransferase
MEMMNRSGKLPDINPGEKQKYFMDFVSNSISRDNFPFSIWSKLLREVLASESSEHILAAAPIGGILELRRAIADHLYQFRGMIVETEQVIIGAGTEYLYNLLIQLLGRKLIFAVEDPGYRKLTDIYESNDVECRHIPMDEAGIRIEELEKDRVDIIHISPSHHFPTGIVMPVSRRYELLSWASKNETRYIIEDDYDCEFRLSGKPIPTLQSIDVMEKVIYLNTFSKNLAPSFRISYMVLPKHLVNKFYETLGFYSCTVSNFEQYTLVDFITKGYFEKHINRMRNLYREKRNYILQTIRSSRLNPYITIEGEDSGLHFLMRIVTKMSDEEITRKAGKAGIHISSLSEYYYLKENIEEHVFIINYSGVDKEKLQEAVKRLEEIIVAGSSDVNLRWER